MAVAAVAPAYPMAVVVAGQAVKGEDHAMTAAAAEKPDLPAAAYSHSHSHNSKAHGCQSSEVTHS